VRCAVVAHRTPRASPRDLRVLRRDELRKPDVDERDVRRVAAPADRRDVPPHRPARLAAASAADHLHADTDSDRRLPRELAGGYSTKEIPRSLPLAEGTAKNHMSEILAKLGTRDRTRAVLKAITLRTV
jgi:DNA-binding NarL/FixJ family response regulator